MKQYFIIIILCMFGTGHLLLAQESINTLRIIDEQGNAITGASLIIGEGAKHVYAEENGTVLVQVKKRTPVLIEAEGYEPLMIYVVPGFSSRTEILEKSVYQHSIRDNVHLPFGSLSMRELPSSYASLDPARIIQYDQEASVNNILRGRVPGLMSINNIRGNGSPLIIVDGIPRSTEGLNIQQIEQITVLKDLNATMLYGSQAQNGAILITTRRGKPLKNHLDIFVENGVRKAISLPKYLSSADYMELFNEALTNDGLAPRYTLEEISNTRSGMNPIRYPDQDYYTSEFVRDWNSFYNVVGESSGGNNVAQYYLNMGWNRSNGFLNLGEGLNEKTDRINLRSNIDYHLNEDIKIRFDGLILFNLSNSPRYSSNDFWSLAGTLRPNSFPLLIPAGLVADSTILESAKLYKDEYLLGGTTEFQNNIYGELTRNGNSRQIDRLVQLSTGLDFDLKSITPGLKASVFLSFDLNNMFTSDLNDNYAVYRPVFDSKDSITSLEKINEDVKQDSRSISNVSFFRRFGTYGTLDYQRVFQDNHELRANFVVYRDEYATDGVFQPAVNMHYGLRANYMFRKKYILQLNGVMAASGKLFESNPYAFSPGMAFGWIISDEAFMNGITNLDFLKMTASVAKSNSDQSFGYYQYQSYYQSGGAYNYNQGASTNNSREVITGNPNLDWEKTSELNLGFEASLFDYNLNIQGGYFNNKNYDLLTNPVNTLPAYFTGHAMINYNANRNHGFELGFNYTTSVEDFRFSIGSNFLYSIPKVLQLDEIHREEYLKRQGKAGDAIFGYIALGLFKDSADIANHQVQTFGRVQPGDIKYKDLNGDGRIDELDQMMIGNSRARYVFSLHFNLKYKNLELFAMGTGQNSFHRFFNNSYYWVYGERKYSEEVLGRWTPGTATTANYPRLSSSSNPNNFQNSTFWLYDNNQFTIHTLQITYSFNNIKSRSIDQLRLFIRGNNLYTFSGIREKLELNTVSSPQSRALSIGFTSSF